MVNNKKRFNLTVEKLTVAMMKKKLPKNLREMFLLSLNQSLDIISITAGKIKLSKDFYDLHIKIHNLDKQTLKIDREQYNFFLKLKKYGLIHARSSYFRKFLSLISINPNPAFVYKVNLGDVDNFLGAKENLYTITNTTSFNETKQLIYNDLRLYQNTPLSEKEISKIQTGNIIFVENNTALIYFEYPQIIENKLPSYYLIQINGEILLSFFKHCRLLGEITPFGESKQLEQNFQKYRQEHFRKLHISYLKMLNQNALLQNETPFSTVIKTGRNILSSATLAEIDYLFSKTVPVHLLSNEKIRIQQSMMRPSLLKEEEQDELELLFSLKDLDKLQKLLHMIGTRQSDISSMRDSVKSVLMQHSNLPDESKHSRLITGYILHLLSRTEQRINGKKKISPSTFKAYTGLLDKHLFTKVEDLNNIQNYELETIFDNLIRLQYKGKSILKIRALVIDFFNFHSRKMKTNLLSTVSYPKSLVFDCELDDILKAIEQREERLAQIVAERRKKKKQVKSKAVSSRVGKRIKYAILQKQTLVLLAYYFGLRKSELRGRLKSDLSSDKGTLCIDVNKKGMEKCKLDLKTSNAQRHVYSLILNKKHLKILKEFWKLRLRIKNKSPFLFLKIDKNYAIKSKPVAETVFNGINKVIQNITKRYTSFHSLRHSFVSYRALHILQDKDSNIYSIINLSVETGHETPELTMKVYTHASLILLKTGERTQ